MKIAGKKASYRAASPLLASPLHMQLPSPQSLHVHAHTQIQYIHSRAHTENATRSRRITAPRCRSMERAPSHRFGTAAAAAASSFGPGQARRRGLSSLSLSAYPLPSPPAAALGKLFSGAGGRRGTRPRNLRARTSARIHARTKERAPTFVCADSHPHVWPPSIIKPY